MNALQGKQRNEGCSNSLDLYLYRANNGYHDEKHHFLRQLSTQRNKDIENLRTHNCKNQGNVKHHLTHNKQESATEAVNSNSSSHQSTISKPYLASVTWNCSIIRSKLFLMYERIMDG